MATNILVKQYKPMKLEKRLTALLEVIHTTTGTSMLNTTTLKTN